ncbi:MAG: PBSX family phage terminase large subunit [Ruminococcus sp.]|nr:PBSX family phage terminase large subunit [Ruminococcus sp.]MBR4021432.1 PBSX family phage terminase large subunit [Ruminococcus sp.]
MEIKSLSEKQKIALRWWNRNEYSGYDAIICDGAVRSGKTLSMSIAFVSWAMTCFDGGYFAMCGKTITSLKRNVINPLLSMLGQLGFMCIEKVSKNYFEITLCNRVNRFYIFGGKDEGSASLIQGITLSGVFLDEVALMPRSFVEQAIARCSVPNSKMWFNCNPEHPYHWFYREWIKKAEEKKALYVHFTMDDNPSLTDEVKERYSRLYSGAFYDRFVLGKWTAVSGAVYPMFDSSKHIFDDEVICDRYVISCDYGTVNPSSFGLWGRCNDKWYRLKEYYYSSKKEGISRTDEEHYTALEELAGDYPIEKVIVDPSAASFIECIHRHGKFRAVRADNDVVTGIRRVCDALKQEKILFHKSCNDIQREFSLYCWNEKAGGDIPVKENDHAMDDMRYFVSEVFNGCDDCFFVGSLAR